MDRIDIHIEMKKLDENELINLPKGEPSEIIRNRVIMARKIQNKRFNSNKGNSNMTQEELKKYCSLSQENKKFLQNAIKIMNISARGYDKILKISRTIADLKNCQNIEKVHILEALSFREK